MASFATLCHIFRRRQILLQLKSKGLFGGGKWNAPGGKLIEGECPESAAIREASEETGLRVGKLRFHGILNFYLGESKRLDQVVFVFSSRNVKGRPKRSAEGRLSWFSTRKIPYDQMWQDDRAWLPLLLQGKSFIGDFHFSEGYGKLESYVLQEIMNRQSG
jgi:8-oxo-dGTP pyrophosphatase MutT (NUDIX family)